MVAMQPRQPRSERTQRSDEEGGGRTLAKVKDQVSDVTDSMRRGVRKAARQAKQQLVRTTQAVSDTLRHEAERLFEQKKGKVASKVAGVGKLSRQAAHAMHAVKVDAVADYLDDAAKRVERASAYIKEQDLGAVLKDAEAIAREHEALAVGGLFLAGFLLGRFLKASGSREQPDRQPASAGAGATARSQDLEEDRNENQEEEDEEDAPGDDASAEDEWDEADDSEEFENSEEDGEDEDSEEDVPSRTNTSHANGRERRRHG